MDGTELSQEKRGKKCVAQTSLAAAVANKTRGKTRRVIFMEYLYHSSRCNFE